VIGALVTLLSLEMTRRLVAAGMVAASFTLVDASNTTPIVVTTSTAHNLNRPTHAVVNGVVGNAGANGVWVMTPTGPTTLSLGTYDRQGAPSPSVGTGVYSSGGIAQSAFPDGAILLGRRNVAMQMAVATPRIVFVPMGSPAWGLDPYGGVIPTATLPRSLAAETAEQKIMKLQRQLATESQRFEVHVTGSAVPSDPDFGDFDATQAIYQTLYAVMFDLISPARAKVLSGTWVSQSETIQLLDTRGQKWVGIVEIQQPVTPDPLAFIPAGTSGTMVVNFVNGASADDTIIVIPS
jgi:hypothetical protein